MSKHTPKSTTHSICNKRVEAEGANGLCCLCFSHEGCEFEDTTKSDVWDVPSKVVMDALDDTVL